MKKYDPDQDIHKIRAKLSLERQRLGPTKALQKMNEEGLRLVKQLGLENRTHDLPIVRVKHLKVA